MKTKSATIELLSYAPALDDEIRAHIAGRGPRTTIPGQEPKGHIVEFFGARMGWLGRVGRKDFDRAIASGAVVADGPLARHHTVRVRLVHQTSGPIAYVETHAFSPKPATKLTDTRADVLALIAQYKHIGEYVPRYKEGAHRGVGMYPVTIAEIAARWLMKHKLVERSQYGGLAITELGRKALLEATR